MRGQLSALMLSVCLSSNRLRIRARELTVCVGRMGSMSRDSSYGIYSQCFWLAVLRGKHFRLTDESLHGTNRI